MQDSSPTMTKLQLTPNVSPMFLLKYVEGTSPCLGSVLQTMTQQWISPPIRVACVHKFLSLSLSLYQVRGKAQRRRTTPLPLHVYAHLHVLPGYSGSVSLSLSLRLLHMYIYLYIYIDIHLFICLCRYIYIYIWYPPLLKPHASGILTALPGACCR